MNNNQTKPQTAQTEITLAEWLGHDDKTGLMAATKEIHLGEGVLMAFPEGKLPEGTEALALADSLTSSPAETATATTTTIPRTTTTTPPPTIPTVPMRDPDMTNPET